MEEKVGSRNYCVYIHTSPSGKKYVGQTGRTPEKRWGSDGSGYLIKKNNKYIQPAFANAILKYGWDNFQHEIVASNLTKEDADELEKLLISKLNTMNYKYGYNLRAGGSNGGLSEESRKKISESTKGEKSHMYGTHLSESTKKKISEFRKGRLASDETRKKISDANKGENNHFYGKRHSEESLKKMSEAHKGAFMGAEHANARKVTQYSLQGDFIKTWDCMSEAGRELGISNHNIYSCCKGNRRTSGGFIWRYFEDSLTDEYLSWCKEAHPDAFAKKRIAQYSLSNEFIGTYESMAEAELKTGVLYSGISLCCNGRRKSAGGFIWKYYKDVNEIMV